MPTFSARGWSCLRCDGTSMGQRGSDLRRAVLRPCHERVFVTFLLEMKRAQEEGVSEFPNPCIVCYGRREPVRLVLLFVRCVLMAWICATTLPNLGRQMLADVRFVSVLEFVSRSHS